jgi:Fur family transcriptional regulator, zinc uptake regulator
MSFVEYSIKVLRSRGYKVTRPRKQVLEAIENAVAPVSPYDIERMVQQQGEHLDPVTVYRVINLLCSLTLVHKLLSRGGFVKCDLLEEPGCHRFLVCRGCGILQEFADDALCRQESQIAQRLGFQAEHHLTESSGLCQRCR